MVKGYKYDGLVSELRDGRNQYDRYAGYCAGFMNKAADAIEELQRSLMNACADCYELKKRIEVLERELHDCRSVLCDVCCRYVNKDKGWCDGCRWEDVK